MCTHDRAIYNQIKSVKHWAKTGQECVRFDEMEAEVSLYLTH